MKYLLLILLLTFVLGNKLDCEHRENVPIFKNGDCIHYIDYIGDSGNFYLDYFYLVIEPVKYDVNWYLIKKCDNIFNKCHINENKHTIYSKYYRKVNCPKGDWLKFFKKRKEVNK